jgi:hypothetical protein
MYPYASVAKDLNGDGHIDLAVANNNSNDVSILLGTGTGSFGSATSFTVSGSAFSVTSADFNGDNKLDLAVATGSVNVVSVLFNMGSGNFSSATDFTVGMYPTSVISADFNGDSFMDLAVNNYVSYDVSILLGTGTGNFSVVTNYPVGTSPFTLNNADLNGDAIVDLVVANAASNDISVLLGTGTGSFATAVNYTVGAGSSPHAITVADFNSDGKKDIAVADFSSNDVSVLLGSGTGSFGAATKVGIVSGAFTITHADFNADGNIDLAVASRGANNATVLMGTGTGTFGNPAYFPVGTQPGGITTADFNGDTKPDLVLTNQLSDNITVLLDAPYPTITIIGDTSICLGNTTTLTASGSISYTWSSNAGSVTTASVSITPSQTDYYTVTGSNCNNTAYIPVYVTTPVTPDICMVTVDDSSKHNIVYWDKTAYTNVDSFIIYRETISNTYKQIGTVSKSALSLFLDTVQTLYFPFTGDPNSGTYRYALQIRDTCGNYSQLSNYHNTIYVTQTGGTFNWNDYQIEGEGIPISELSAYYLYRDNNNTNTWTLVTGVSGSQTNVTDNSYASYPNANWRIETIWTISCSPTLRMGNNSTQSAVVKSRSNIKNNRVASINSIINNLQIAIYPQPASQEVVVNFASVQNKATFEIYNTLGELVQKETAQNTQTVNLNIESLNVGVYSLVIITEKSNVTKKLIKE